MKPLQSQTFITLDSVAKILEIYGHGFPVGCNVQVYCSLIHYKE